MLFRKFMSSKKREGIILAVGAGKLEAEKFI